MGAIYCLEFANGKKYIGMTSQLLADRMVTHRIDARSKGAAVYRAWRKYGEPKASILAFVEKHMLRDTERKAIAVFNTMVPNGYNLVAGGEGGGVSAESRRKMSEARKGVPKSPEHRKKIGDANRGKIWATRGRKQTPEHIAKRAAANKGKKRSQEFCDRISAWNTGIVRTEAEKLKRSETMKAVRKARFWSSRKQKQEIV